MSYSFIQIIFLFLFLPNYSFAYLDPGSISLALQAVIAAIAGLAATSKMWFYKVKALILKSKKQKDEISKNTDINR